MSRRTKRLGVATQCRVRSRHLIGGQVQMMIEVMPNAYPQVEGGKLRGLAVTTAKRWPTASTVPTLAEAGVAGFEVTASDALFAPRGTPKPLIDKLNSAVRKALDDAQLRAGLLERGAEPVASAPEELARHVASEVERWGKVVRASAPRSIEQAPLHRRLMSKASPA